MTRHDNTGVRRHGGMRVLVYAAAAITAATALHGCNTSGCLENRNSVPLAGFYSSSNGQAIALDSLRISGIGKTDSTSLCSEGESVSTIYMPMRSTHDTTTWVFAYKWHYLDFEELCDTLSFVYDSRPYFASEECGVIYKYHISKVDYTTHLIDSVAITDSVVTNVDIERIKIYFHTSDEPEE